MSRSILSILRSQRGLINYAVLNYLDKLLNFAAPLVVLYLFNSRKIYNDIEYIYSIAAVATIIIELGVRNYFLYAFKEASDRDELVKHVKGYFLFQFAIYVVLGVSITIVSWLTQSSVGVILLFITVRTLFVYFVSFFAVYYRLVDAPSKVFIPSLTVNGATLLIILAARYYFHTIDLWYFFVSQMGLVLLTAVTFFAHYRDIAFSHFVGYVKQSLRYAWPIILNLLLFLVVNNFGKIYARNFLSEGEMFHISFAQRMALIIQLAHMSAVGYLSKRIFIDPARGVSSRVLKLYSAVIFASVGGVVVLLTGMNALHLKATIAFDAITVLIILYTIVWCYLSFFEMYMNKANRTRYVLLFSSISSVIFGVVIGGSIFKPLTNISLAMFLSMLCNLILTVWFVYKRIAKNYIPAVESHSHCKTIA